MGILGDIWREFVATFKGEANADKSPRKPRKVRIDKELAKASSREDRVPEKAMERSYGGAAPADRGQSSR